MFFRESYKLTLSGVEGNVEICQHLVIFPPDLHLTNSNFSSPIHVVIS